MNKREYGDFLDLSENELSARLSSLSAAAETLAMRDISEDERADALFAVKSYCLLISRDAERQYDYVRALFGSALWRPARKRLVPFVEELISITGRYLKGGVSALDVSLKDESFELTCDVDRFARLFYITASAFEDIDAPLSLSVSETEGDVVFLFSKPSPPLSDEKLALLDSPKDENAPLPGPKDPKAPFFYADRLAKMHKGDLTFGYDAKEKRAFGRITVPKRRKVEAASLEKNAKLVISLSSIAAEEFCDVNNK